MPAPDEIAVAEQTIAAAPVPPVYGRVDLVRADDGTLRIMELELIEPELWLRFHPPAAAVFARGIARTLGLPFGQTPTGDD
jgi:hypothetical protein